MVAPGIGPDPGRAARIVEALRSQAPEPVQPSNHTASFLISAALFLGLASAGAGILGAAILLLAVLLHELGHYAAMRAFGYRNARILLLPLFGGATMGAPERPDAFQRAVVSLAGPAPSVLLGAALAFAAFPLHSPLAMRAAMTLLWLNLFNLLPVVGLDGGNFAQNVLSPSPRVALAFRLVTGAAGLAWAASSRSPLMGLWFGAMTVAAWTQEYPRDALARRARGDAPQAAVPPERLAWLVAEIEGRRAGAPIEEVAREAAQVWARAREAPLEPGRRPWLAAAYLGCWGVGLAGLFGWRLLLL